MKNTPSSPAFYYFLSALGAAFFVGFSIYRIGFAGDAVYGWSLLWITDFANFWTASRLAVFGDVHVVFDPSAFFSQMQAYFAVPVEWRTWSYPPSLLVFLAPFASLTYWQALLCWSVLGLLAAYGVMRRLIPIAHWQWLALISPASFISLAHGQTGLLFAACLIGGLVLMPRRPWLAGTVFGFLSLKPQLALLLPLLLLLRGEWKVIAAAIVCAAVLIGVSVLLWGSDPWILYFEKTSPLHLKILEDFNGYYTLMMPGFFASLRHIGVDASTALILHGMFALPCIVLGVHLLRRGTPINPRGVLAFAIASFLVSPYGFTYDMAAIAFAVCALLARGSMLSAHLRLLLPIVWLTPVLAPFWAAGGVPLTPFFLVWALLRLVNVGNGDTTASGLKN